MVRQKRGGKTMTKHFYAVLGLSEPKVYDSVVGAYVPFQLSEAEHQFLVEEQIGDNLPEIVSKAFDYFETEHPSGRIYYKRSRWTPTAKLYALNVNEALQQVGCRDGSRFVNHQINPKPSNIPKTHHKHLLNKAKLAQ